MGMFHYFPLRYIYLIILMFLIVFPYFVHRSSWKNLHENLTVCKKETL